MAIQQYVQKQKIKIHIHILVGARGENTSVP
jgi:hypothetical protein